VRCAYHPNAETELACGRCNTPICPRCLIHTEVGIRCPKCCQEPEKRHLLLGTLLAFGAVALLVSFVAIPPLLGVKPRVPPTDFPTTSTLPPVAVMPTPSYDLVIVTSTCTRDDRSSTCTGSVKNVSGHNLQQVQVVVEQARDDGIIQTSNVGPIDYDPLLPDQESPWTLHPSFNPALTKYTITFRTATGQPLLSRKETP
jgi:hypothetical protein